MGKSLEECWTSYKSSTHCFSEKYTVLVGALPNEIKDEIMALRFSDVKYKSLDDTVLFAIYTARKAIKDAGWKSTDNFGINIGSSRGATQLFEAYHEDFLKSDKTPPLASPNTTLGNISSWVAHDLKTPMSAEINALNNSTETPSGAIAYVPLEPCSHFGKTPPCSDLIIKYNIPKVVIGCKDDTETMVIFLACIRAESSLITKGRHPNQMSHQLNNVL